MLLVQEYSWKKVLTNHFSKYGGDFATVLTGLDTNCVVPLLRAVYRLLLCNVHCTIIQCLQSWSLMTDIQTV